MDIKTVNYIKKGFTLAEVLIVVAIISVIASFTIPSLLQYIQEAQYRTAFKQKYSVFSQAFAQMRNDNGGTLASVFRNNDLNSFYNQFIKYMNVISYSGASTTSTNFDWHDNGYYKSLNSSTGRIICDGCPSATLADGSFFMVKLGWGSNDMATCDQSGSYPRAGLCFNLIFDVNGKHTPNIMGKDIYLLSVYKDKTVPADWNNFGGVNKSSCSSSDTGEGCAIQYMVQ